MPEAAAIPGDPGKAAADIAAGHGCDRLHGEHGRMPVATEALGDPGLRAIFNFDNATTRNLRIEQTRNHAVLPQDRDA